MTERTRFYELLACASAELFADNPSSMSTGDLVPTPNVIDDEDLGLFFAALDNGLLTLHRGGRFNTLHRPTIKGRWSLLSRSTAGGWYNAEYLPQIAAYADAILNLGYPASRVFFELPPVALQLDLAVLDDSGNVVVVGEAKRDTAMLTRLRQSCLQRFSDNAPTVDSKLIGPGQRTAYRTTVDPLILEALPQLPQARELGLEHEPPAFLTPPALAERPGTH